MDRFPVPVNRSGVNFSPSPLTAPPPFGSEMTEPSTVESVPALIASHVPQRTASGPADEKDDVQECAGVEQRRGVRSEAELPVARRGAPDEGNPRGRVAPAGARDAAGGGGAASGRAAG